jgi:hypothetical protein
MQSSTLAVHLTGSFFLARFPQINTDSQAKIHLGNAMK